MGAVLVGGCSGKSSSKTAAASAGRTIGVRATDFSYTQAIPQTLPAGAAHISLTNDSKTYQHELWIFPAQQSKLQDLLAQKAAGQDVNEEDYLQGVAGKVEDLDPGKTSSFDVTLTPGTYEYACFIVTNIGGKDSVHYTLGIHGTFTVQ